MKNYLASLGFAEGEGTYFAGLRRCGQIETGTTSAAEEHRSGTDFSGPWLSAQLKGGDLWFRVSLREWRSSDWGSETASVREVERGSC